MLYWGGRYPMFRQSPPPQNYMGALSMLGGISRSSLVSFRSVGRQAMARCSPLFKPRVSLSEFELSCFESRAMFALGSLCSLPLTGVWGVRSWRM
jgi:hypothetical protein